MARIDAFPKLGTQQGCSDIHLAVGVPPMLRMHGDLMPIKFRDLRQPELEGYLTEILTRNQADHFAKGHDIDFSYVSAEGGRFRVNVFRKETGIGATFRAIPTGSADARQAAASPIVTKLCDYHQGMVLVTGSTGTGKSTTLAAMIDHLNQTRRLNIISLEDPIEFVHRSKNSQVIQRELNTHIPTFAEGVRAAMREDPDVILVGELRDAETISMAMTAAETGHPRARHAAYDRRREDHRPHHRRAADRRARADQELPRTIAAGGGDAGAHQDRRRARPQRDVRSDGDDEGHRQADPDGSDASDSRAAADRPRCRHAGARPGAARGDRRERNRSGRRVSRTRPTSACSRSTSPTPPCCRSST